MRSWKWTVVLVAGAVIAGAYLPNSASAHQGHSARGGRASNPLTVKDVTKLCTRTPKGKYHVWVKGNFAPRTIHYRATGGMGGLYAGKVPAYPDGGGNYVVVEYAHQSPHWIKAGSVVIHGLLDCFTGSDPKVQGYLFADKWKPVPHALNRYG